jgi:hypothetical protein
MPSTPPPSSDWAARIDASKDEDKRVQPWKNIVGESARMDVGEGIDQKVSYINMHDGKDGFANVNRCAVGVAG